MNVTTPTQCQLACWSTEVQLACRLATMQHPVKLWVSDPIMMTSIQAAGDTTRQCHPVLQAKQKTHCQADRQGGVAC
jgi:hypothetical protein